MSGKKERGQNRDTRLLPTLVRIASLAMWGAPLTGPCNSYPGDRRGWRCRDLTIIYVRTYTTIMGRHSFRDIIITSGTQTVHQRGFATVGLREITAAAGVAQGSFTSHFASKEEFGVEVLNHYSEQIREVIAQTLIDESRRPIERLRAYFDAITDLFAAVGWRYGCLAGNMGLEAAEHSEVIRQRLSEIFAEWTLPFVEVIREAQTLGEIRADLDSEEASAALLEAWHGAMLRMKIERTPAPLDRFKRLIFPALLGCSALS